jgi:hypothetical protein
MTNQTPSEVAKEYKDKGWKPIPVPAGEKGPRDPDWQSRTYDPQHFNGHNVGVQLGPVSHGLTDIDLDCPEAVALASHFLPQTGAIFGRASKPKSHYLYVIEDPDPKATEKINDDQGNTIIELRMGGGGKGAQTVFPGSVHPEGEKIEWAMTGDPARTKCADLKNAIMKIAVASLLARHWPAHGRHDVSMRCGGFLARAGWDADTIDDFMRSVLMTAGIHEHARIDDGCRSARNAAEKHHEDGKGYGRPAMVEFFGEEVTKAISKILRYKEIDTNDVLERMNEKYFVVGLRGKARVGTFDLDQSLDPPREVAVFSSINDFRTLIDHPRIPVLQGEKSKKISRGAWWLNNPLRQQYDGITFIPGAAKVINGKLNMWRDWGVQPKAGSWRRLRRHIWKVLACKNKKHFRFIMLWTAWCLQNPALMAEVALVFRGNQGVGKSLFGRALCQAFGQHGLQISSHNHLTGRFNAHQMDCAMLFADEAFWPGDKSSEGSFKRLISEDTLTIEFKGIDVFHVRNAIKLIMSSNADWVVPAAIDDRRCAVFDVSKEYASNSDYFTPLYKEIKDGGIAAMMWDLMRMDLNGWHPRYNVPKTAALREQQELSLHPADQWWHQLLQSGALPRASDAEADANPRRARARLLMDAAKQTVPGLRYSSDHILGRILGKNGCRKCRVNNHPAWEFPVLAEARKAWDERWPGNEWDEDENAEWGNDDGVF